ncbi:MAG: polysaccharide deacetylase family protein [Pirellula sp.]|nr:polysaccharide deacetylase family protein [Pirellula sp.]
MQISLNMVDFDPSALNETLTNAEVIMPNRLKRNRPVITGVSFFSWLLVIAMLSIVSSHSTAADSTSNKKLIVHIDDAGMCHAANVATIRALESGAVTSTSIMMNCSWAKEFTDYARQHPEFCYGVHLTLNSEWSGYRWGPVAGRDRVPSLVDPDGYLWRSVSQVAEHAKASEVEIELRAQIELAKQHGVPISHLDTHMGAVMSRLDIVEVYIKLAMEYDLPMLWLRTMSAEQKNEYPHFAATMARTVDQMDQRKLPVLDHLLQFYGPDDLVAREKIYSDAIDHLKDGISLLIIHSALDGSELEAITTSHKRRHQDFELFSRPEQKESILKKGIELTSWKQLTQDLRR